VAEDEDGSISVPEAAERLGVSERTIRRRIKQGAIRATSVETAQGHIWRIDPASLARHPATPPGTVRRHPADATRREDAAIRHSAEETRQNEDATRQSAVMPAGTPGTPPGTVPEVVLVLLDELRQEYRDRIAELEDKNERNIAAATHWQARATEAERRAQYAEEQVKLLMAPKDDPAPEPPAEPVGVSWWKRWWSS
jgi:excisionase family DNA binding protein